MEPTNAWTYATNKRIVFGRICRGQAISLALADLGLKPEQALALIDLGSVYWNLKRLGADLCPLSSAELRVHLQPRRFDDHYDWASLLVDTLDSHLVVHKPAGLPVHPSLDNRRENVLYHMELLLGERLNPVHRLDVDTEGLLLLARGAKAAATIQRCISQRKIKRTYEALVQNPLPEGIYTHYMQSSARAPKIVSREPPGLCCQLKILSCTQAGDWYELHIELITGRTHQIRAQLSALGCPIRGDSLYHGEPDQRLHLRAFQLDILGRCYSLRHADSPAKILDNPGGE